MGVVHLKRDEYDVRIDRQTIWGNPFAITAEHSRQEVINAYEIWLIQALENPENKITWTKLANLAGKTLGCWCAPKACHGQVLEQWSGIASRFLSAQRKVN